MHPVLWTENFEETLEFYTQILSFKIENQDVEWKWAFLVKDSVKIMISSPNRHEKMKDIGFSGSFYFNVDEVDSVWEDVKAKAKICYEIETFSWGVREFAVYDTNGYILQFGENMPENNAEE